jgi:CO/xanthine dehydrogenase FAD-binding subunit
MGWYLRPTSLDAALTALVDRELSVLAGGTDHFPARAIHAPDEDILDITALPDLRGIVWRDDHWWLPCLATWTDLIRARMPAAFDALTEAARQVGGPQVQNVGTIVGNLCNASPAADGIPCLLALDAEVELASVAGRRVLPLADFLRGPRQTARRRDELVLGLRIPPTADGARSVFQKLGARRYLVISIVMVAAELTIGADGRIERARVAVGACAPVARRLPALEAALTGALPDPALARAEHLAVLAPIDDVRATAEYRLAAALELVRRAIASLAEPRARAA